MFCGTYQTYCSALPSSNPTWLKQPSPGGTTAGPAGKKPSALRGEIECVVGLNRFCQYCARSWNSPAVSESSSAAANWEMAKSSTDHSSEIDAAGKEPWHDVVGSGR